MEETAIENIVDKWSRTTDMKRVLVAYGTNAGSTADVAAVVGEVLGEGGAAVDVRRIREVTDLSEYEAVVVGAPMLLGSWLKEAFGFVADHQRALSQVPVALFITSLHLTQFTANRWGTIPIYQDPALAKPPRDPDRLTFAERQTSVGRYLDPVLQKAPLLTPVSVGFFAGKLDYQRLSLAMRLFAHIVFRKSKPGDFRNWPAIRAWAASVRPLLLVEERSDDGSERSAATVAVQAP